MIEMAHGNKYDNDARNVNQHVEVPVGANGALLYSNGKGKNLIMIETLSKLVVHPLELGCTQMNWVLCTVQPVGQYEEADRLLYLTVLNISSGVGIINKTREESTQTQYKDESEITPEGSSSQQCSASLFLTLHRTPLPTAKSER